MADRAVAELERSIAMLQKKLDTDPSADRGALQATIEFQASRLADLKATHGGGVDDYGDDDDDDDDDYAADLAARAARPAPTTLTREQIREMFDYYANFGRSNAMGFQDTIDSFMFMKFAKECPDLLDGHRLTRTDVDLTFTKAKPKFERRLGFSHFLDALTALAEKRCPAPDAATSLRQLIAHHLAPQFEMVQMEKSKTADDEAPISGVFKRLYDVSSYTGVYKERFKSGDGRINSHSSNRAGKGFQGNTNTGTDETIHSIAQVMRPNLRSQGGSMKTLRRGQSKRSNSPTRTARAAARGTPRAGTPKSHASPRGTPRSTPRGMGRSASAGRERFPSPAQRDVWSSVHGDGGAATDDLLGAMSAARRGNAEPLCALAQRLAEENQALQRELASLKRRGGAPAPAPAPASPTADMSRPTRTAPTRTSSPPRAGLIGSGSAAAPPPPPPAASAGASRGTGDLQDLQRQVADLTNQLRGLPPSDPRAGPLVAQLKRAETEYEAALAVSIHRAQGGGSGAGAGAGGGGGSASRRPKGSRSHGRSRRDVLQEAQGPPPPQAITEEHLRDIFSWYANFGRSGAQDHAEGIDSFMFMKFAKDCPDLLGSHVTRTDVDLVFTKAKPKFERRLSFKNFLDALSALSEKRYPRLAPADGLRQLLSHSIAPVWSHVQAERSKTGENTGEMTGVFKRLYDVSTYTGVYAERFRSGDGRINSHSGNRAGKSFNGSTNAGTDENIHSIASIMRPNLASGSTMSRKKSGRAASPSRARGRRAKSPTRQASGSKPRWGVSTNSHGHSLIDRQAGGL